MSLTLVLFSLGCDIGFGYLHRIPYHLSKNVSKGENMKTESEFPAKSSCGHDHGPGHSHNHDCHQHDHSHGHDHDHGHDHSHGSCGGHGHDHSQRDHSHEQKPAQGPAVDGSSGDHVHGAGCNHGHDHSSERNHAAHAAHPDRHHHNTNASHGHSHKEPQDYSQASHLPLSVSGLQSYQGEKRPLGRPLAGRR